ncbi:uncharacterized [Tachysurus ichikawai]
MVQHKKTQKCSHVSYVTPHGQENSHPALMLELHMQLSVQPGRLEASRQLFFELGLAYDASAVPVPNEGLLPQIFFFSAWQHQDSCLSGTANSLSTWIMI